MKKTTSCKIELTHPFTENIRTAHEYFDQGNEKFNLKDYKGAIAAYTKAIEIDQKNTMSYYYRGRAKILLQDMKGAIKDFETAVKIPLIAKN